MKKLIFMVFALMITSITFAQKIQEKDVPAAVKATFKKLYPETKNVKWEKENANYEASFVSKNIEQSIVLDPNGNMLETEMEIDKHQLPVGVLDYIVRNYPGQEVKEAAMITKNDGVVVYEAELKDMDLLFSANGEFLKKTKK